MLLDRVGPIEYGLPLPSGYTTDQASGEECHEVQTPEAPYGLTLLVRDGAVLGARMVGPNWRTRSGVGPGDLSGRPLEVYGAARISEARFEGKAGVQYTPASENLNRIGFVVRDGRVAELIGGSDEVVAAGAQCSQIPLRADIE